MCQSPYWVIRRFNVDNETPSSRVAAALSWSSRVSACSIILACGELGLLTAKLTPVELRQFLLTLDLSIYLVARWALCQHSQGIQRNHWL